MASLLGSPVYWAMTVVAVLLGAGCISVIRHYENRKNSSAHAIPLPESYFPAWETKIFALITLAGGAAAYFYTQDQGRMFPILSSALTLLGLCLLLNLWLKSALPNKHNDDKYLLAWPQDSAFLYVRGLILVWFAVALIYFVLFLIIELPAGESAASTDQSSTPDTGAEGSEAPEPKQKPAPVPLLEPKTGQEAPELDGMQ